MYNHGKDGSSEANTVVPVAWEASIEHCRGSSCTILNVEKGLDFLVSIFNLSALFLWSNLDVTSRLGISIIEANEMPTFAKDLYSEYIIKNLGKFRLPQQAWHLLTG